jgi:spermidine synthase
VIPWVQLDSAKTPDGAQELRLKQRGAEFSIMLGTNELMNSRLSGSEQALAKLSCDRIAGHSRPKILIGGLGMGFTLRAALTELSADASVTVAELVPAVIAWARGPMAALFAGCLDNPRVNIREADVGHIIRSDVSAWDAVLLDVDNGPEGIVHKGNDALYSAAGLTAARTALKPGGVLAVWSQGPDNGFTRRLKQAGFAVEEVKTRANGKRGARHVIWIATNPSS